MSVTADIARSYLRPGAVIRRRLADGPREDRALAILMAASVLSFVAGLPAHRRAAFLGEGPPFDEAAAGALVGGLVIAPLMFYAIAATSHVVARALGGRGTWYGARLALFWALLAASPVLLLRGLVLGLIGPGPEATLVSVLAAAAFLFIWLRGLWAAETSTPRPQGEVA